MTAKIWPRIIEERAALLGAANEILLNAVQDAQLTADEGLKIAVVGEMLLTAYEGIARAASQSTSDHFLFATDLPRQEREDRTTTQHLIKVLRTIHREEK
jgi:hypothetical protein